MKKKDVGLVLIIIGVLMWPLGHFLEWTPIPNTLSLHLLFVIPGVFLRGSKILRKLRGSKQ